MGDRYCEINSLRGSRMGQKSRYRRSIEFYPKREPSGELIAQYRPAHVILLLSHTLCNHLVFFKPVSSSKEQQEYIYLGNRQRLLS